MFIAPLVEIINGTSFIAMRSIISKLVPSDELGMECFKSQIIVLIVLI